MRQKREPNQPIFGAITNRTILVLLLLSLAALIFTSCSSPAGAATPTVSIPVPLTATSVPPPPTPLPTAAPAVIEPPYLAWVDPALPLHLRWHLAQVNYLDISANERIAQIKISLEPGLEAGSWLYVAAAPFYSDLENILAPDLYSCWVSGSNPDLPFSHLLLTEDSEHSLSLLWGDPNQSCVEIVSDNDLTDILWTEKTALALLPFENIEPAHKILTIDGEDPLSSNFNPANYPLALRFNFHFSKQEAKISIDENYYLTNYDPSKLTSIALTGVTALVRNTAYIMEEQGIQYPAGDVQSLLANADITHINNEVPFAIDCPFPDPSQLSLQFCSDDRYIELLEAVGTDIVELSGDHFGDWGPEAMLHTLDLYDQKGWLVYGGGRTLAAGLAPVYITHNDNHFVFIGCNAKNVDQYATASDQNPGAAQCDFSQMTADITRLSEEGFIIIATMQHEEVDSFSSIALQRYDFRGLAEAGAVIVSGSQSHHPQAFEFTGTSFIHYGLGNLFFDQWRLAQVDPEIHANKDKAFIDYHYFYDGKYIGTRLIPLQFIDNARPRPMTIEEKIPFLSELYEYSYWAGDWIYLYSSGYMAQRTDQ